jgi:ketosteroid isomerase-like protein
MSILENAKELYQMLAEGKTMEALDKFYHQDVKVTEVPTNEVRVGLENQRKACQEFMNMVEIEHEHKAVSITANEETGTTMIEAFMDMTYKGMGRIQENEVAVQHWKDGKIIEEKFYYHRPNA